MPIVTRTGDGDYSPTWKWSNDETLEGVHVEFRKASVPERGEVVVWELKSDEHGPVSIWVDPTNLLAKVQRELQNRQRERGSASIEAGERVRINPGVKRPSKRNPAQTVWPFPLVWFEHGAPDRSAEELLLANTSTAAEENGEDALDAAASAPPLPAYDIPF